METLPERRKKVAPSKEARALSVLKIREIAGAKKKQRSKEIMAAKKNNYRTPSLEDIKYAFFLENGQLKYANDVEGGNGATRKKRGDLAGSYTEIAKKKGNGVACFTINGSHRHISTGKAVFGLIYGFFPPERYNAICINGDIENLSKENIALKPLRESIADGREKKGRKGLRNVQTIRNRKNGEATYQATLMHKRVFVRSRVYKTAEDAAQRANQFRKALMIREIKSMAKQNNITISVNEIMDLLSIKQ
jgi:hypothetical protein